MPPLQRARRLQARQRHHFGRAAPLPTLRRRAAGHVLRPLHHVPGKMPSLVQKILPSAEPPLFPAARALPDARGAIQPLPPRIPPPLMVPLQACMTVPYGVFGGTRRAPALVLWLLWLRCGASRLRASRFCSARNALSPTRALPLRPVSLTPQEYRELVLRSPGAARIPSMPVFATTNVGTANASLYASTQARFPRHLPTSPASCCQLYPLRRRRRPGTRATLKHALCPIPRRSRAPAPSLPRTESVAAGGMNACKRPKAWVLPMRR